MAQAPATQREFAAMLIAELREAWRTLPFVASLARNGIAVIGVVFFAWPALHLASFFLIESWLLLSLYAATDLSFNPKYGGRAPLSLREAMLKPLPQFLIAAVFVAGIVALFGGLTLVYAFDAEDWKVFFQEGWRQRSFLVGLAILAASCLSEAIGFARRIATRTPLQIEADDLRIASLFYRILLLFMAAVVLGWTRGTAFAAPLFAVALALLLLFFEALPRSAAALLGIGGKSRGI